MQIPSFRTSSQADGPSQDTPATIRGGGSDFAAALADADTGGRQASRQKDTARTDAPRRKDEFKSESVARLDGSIESGIAEEDALTLQKGVIAIHSAILSEDQGAASEIGNADEAVIPLARDETNNSPIFEAARNGASDGPFTHFIFEGENSAATIPVPKPSSDIDRLTDLARVTLQPTAPATSISTNSDLKDFGAHSSRQPAVDAAFKNMTSPNSSISGAFGVQLTKTDQDRRFPSSQGVGGDLRSISRVSSGDIGPTRSIHAPAIPSDLARPASMSAVTRHDVKHTPQAVPQSLEPGGAGSFPIERRVGTPAEASHLASQFTSTRWAMMFSKDSPKPAVELFRDQIKAPLDRPLLTVTGDAAVGPAGDREDGRVSSFGALLSPAAVGAVASQPSAGPISPPSGHVPAAVAQQLAAAMTAGKDKSVELALNPVELGRVRMSIRSQDHVLALFIQVDRPETADLMRRHVDTLSAEFRQMGYSDLTLDISTGNEGSERGDESNLPSADGSIGSSVAQISDDRPAHLTARSGGLDLKV